MTDPELNVHPVLSRRRFLGAFSATVAFTLVPYRNAWARFAPPRPVPRPGITGSKVLTDKQLANSPKLIPLFNSG